MRFIYIEPTKVYTINIAIIILPPPKFLSNSGLWNKMAATYSPAPEMVTSSTIGATGLNFSVRNGNSLWIQKMKRAPSSSRTQGSAIKWRLPTLRRVCSTIGATVLNFSVRNGKRWNHSAITTGNILLDVLPLQASFHALVKACLKVFHWKGKHSLK